MNGQRIAYFGALLAWSMSDLHAIDATPLGTVEKFDSAPSGPFQTGFIDIHRWSEDFRRRARSWSSIGIVPDGTGKALRVKVSDP